MDHGCGYAAVCRQVLRVSSRLAIEVVVTAPADYPTKVQIALRSGAKDPDIVCAEPQSIQTFIDAGFFEDLDQEPYNAQQYADNFVDYVWAAGQDANGVQRCISYQITPSAIFYRRDIAEAVYGTSDPEAIAEKFATYDAVLQTGKDMKEARLQSICFHPASLAFSQAMSPGSLTAS